MQEREVSGLEDCIIEHTAIQRYIINMHSLHNAHLIRTVIPRTLTAPVPYARDRTALHNKLAALLREDHAKKQNEKAKKKSDSRIQNMEQGDRNARPDRADSEILGGRAVKRPRQQE